MNNNHVTKLECDGKEIILIATAHVSKQSAELVKQVINEERPDSVCVELDEERYQNIQNPKAWENTDIVKVIKSKKVGLLLASLVLGSYQKRIAKKLDTIVGAEMLQGIESARDVGANLVLADRSVQTTFLRIWRKLSLWEKSKLFWSLLFSFEEDTDVSDQDLQEMMQKDMLESAIAGMRQEFPQIGEVLISERDQYLSAKIKAAPGRKIVAVLGGAHVPGVTKELFEIQDLERISVIPEKSRLSKLAAWGIPLLITGLIVYGFALNMQTGLEQLSAWVLWTGALAALFTAVSLGHPLSILTAFVVAPMTTLHPLFACGWFAGLVEAAIRKPTVQDVQNIQSDIFSLKGFFKNRFLKTLLIVVMANIGASLGTLTAGMHMLKTLF